VIVDVDGDGDGDGALAFGTRFADFPTLPRGVEDVVAAKNAGASRRLRGQGACRRPVAVAVAVAVNVNV
jgi:hypothetical protein